MEKFIKRKLSPNLKYTKVLLDDLFTMVNDMNKTTSSNEKKKTYAKYMKDPKYLHLADLIKMVYNPLVRFNVTPKNCLKFEKTVSKQAKVKNKSIIPVSYTDTPETQTFKNSALYKLLIDLSEREVSGDLALASLSKFRRQFAEHTDDILLIIGKDLKMRFGVKQMNTILKEIDPNKVGVGAFEIPNFEVSLGYAFDEKTKKLLTTNHKTSKVDTEWFISRKLDGVRCIAMVKFNEETDDLDITFYSRTGLTFDSLGKIKTAIRDYVCPNLSNDEKRDGVVFDGELCIVDNNGNEDFQSVMRELQRPDHTIKNPKYLLFDYLTLQEFNDLVTTPERKLSVRHAQLRKLIENSNVPFVRLEMVQQIPYTPEAFGDMSKHIQSKEHPHGWEGLILRKNTIYKGKRSNDILKVKKFEREEFKVISIEKGVMPIFNDGKPIDIETLAAVHILYENCDVRVGSGFTHSERQKFYKHPESIVGKIISVQYFEVTTDKKGKKSLRFPTFLGIYGEKRSL